MLKIVLILAVASATIVPRGNAWQASEVAYPPKMEGATAEVYKTVDGAELKLYIFDPPGFTRVDGHPAIVFFFGGGWRNGSPQQFEQQSRYFASRGMVAIAADYRVFSRQGVKVPDCVRDAKSAIRWVRLNASRLGVNPSRIAAGGGSSGGHLAASTALIPGLDEAGEDVQVSSRPDALVLFSWWALPVRTTDSSTMGGKATSPTSKRCKRPMSFSCRSGI